MVQYHFRTKEGPSLGPIGSDEFQQRLEAGDISDETMVWRSGMLDWTTYADLRAKEERAKLPPPLPGSVPPPLPAKESHHAASRPAVQFIACGICGQDWPENLLNPHGNKHICGNCIRKQGDNLKKARLQNKATGVSAEWGKWFVKVLLMALVIGGFMFARFFLKSEVRRGSRSVRYELNSKDRTFQKLPPRETAPGAKP